MTEAYTDHRRLGLDIREYRAGKLVNTFKGKRVSKSRMVGFGVPDDGRKLKVCLDDPEKIVNPEDNLCIEPHILLETVEKKGCLDTFGVEPRPKKLSPKQILIDEMFKPDKDGYSTWVSRQRLDESKLNWGSNGLMRHGVCWGDDRYMWDKQGKGAITALRTNGFSEDYLHGHERPIRKDIHKDVKSSCVVCGNRSSLVTDHKNDLYNDPRVLNKTTQTVDDFQCLCNHCNLQKRQVSKETTTSGKRVGATTIPSVAVFGVDFIKGDETFDRTDINAMVGTYWYDPVKFMKTLRKNLTK